MWFEDENDIDVNVASVLIDTNLRKRCPFSIDFPVQISPITLFDIAMLRATLTLNSKRINKFSVAETFLVGSLVRGRISIIPWCLLERV